MAMLRHEFEGLIGAYLRNERGLDDLRTWLLDHVQAILDTSDARLDRLDGELWRLLSEYDRRNRDEQSVRDVLTAILPGQATTAARSRPSRSSPSPASRTGSRSTPSSGG
jgi:hypothetical protein